MENTVNTANDALCGEGGRGSVQQHPSFLSVTNMDANHETGLQGEIGDFITILTSKSPCLTKTWEKDGTLTGHGKAKQHTVKTVPVNNIREVADVFFKLRSQSTAGIIRGEWIGREAEALVPDPNGEREVGFTLRQMAYFNDPGHYWILFDVDGFVPKTADPVANPEAAIREWIHACLPPEFIEITCYWHLSSSAGHPSKAGSLRAHIVFYMSRKLTSPEAAAYVTMAKIPVDRAPLHVIQLNYTADPVFAPGVVDPVPHRAGLLEGLFGDVVNVAIDNGALAVALVELSRGTMTSGGGEGGAAIDPRQKRGLVGAFCRAFSVEDVLYADWFKGSFEKVNDRRWTWLDGGGSAEGAYITEDGQRFVVTHNTAPCNTIGKGLNAYDLTRVYNFGHLDDAVAEEDRWAWSADLAARPSEGAMRAFAASLPEVKAEMEAARSTDNPFTLTQAEQVQELAERPVAVATEIAPDVLELLGPPPVLPLAAVEPNFINMPKPVVEKTLDEQWGLVMGEKIKHRVLAMGLTDEERADLIDSQALSSAWLGCIYNPGNSKMYLMNKAGQVVQFGPTRWQRMIQQTFGKFLRHDVLVAISTQLEAERGTKRADVEKELRKVVWDTFSENVELYRQRSEVAYRVDMFATAPSIVLTQDRAEITYVHEDFKIRPTGLSSSVEAAILAEYREHFRLFDEFLDLMLYARFATDRRQAFLHMQCLAGFGKGFLLQGVLGSDGLGIVVEMSVDDVERCFEGAPSGLQPSDFVRTWVLAVDEFKSAKSELKQLNNRVSMAPKGQLRSTVEVYLKLFLSAESVDSLAGSEGVEAQFADRFSMYEMPEGTPRLDDRPLFKQHGKTRYRTVISNYVAQQLNAGVTRMRAMDKVAASKAADDGLAQFHAAYGLANTRGLLADHLPEIAAEVTSLINEWALHKEGMGTAKRLDLLPNSFKAKLDAAIRVVTGRAKAGDAPGKLIVTSGLSAVVKDYISMFKDPSQRVLVTHKTNTIIKMITGRNGDTGFYYDEAMNQKSIRGAVLPLKLTPELLAGAAELRGADILAFADISAKA